MTRSAAFSMSACVSRSTPRTDQATAVRAQDKEGQPVMITEGGGGRYRRAAGFWWSPALLAVSVLLIATSSLAALAGLVWVLRRKIPRLHLLPRLLPLLALATTAWAFGNCSRHVSTDGQPGRQAAVVASLGPLVAFALAGVGLTVRYFRQFRRPAVAWFLLLTYGALGWVAAVYRAYG